MSKKSAFELEIVEQSIILRTKHNKSQAYLAMILDVSDGYIGHIENPHRPEMYTHDQINAIAHDFDISPQDFYPSTYIIQTLPKRNPLQSIEKANIIKDELTKLISTGFFKEEKSVKEIIGKLKDKKDFPFDDLTNKDITDQTRPLVKSGLLRSTRVSNKNYYTQP